MQTGYRPKENLEPKLAWLQKRLNLGDKSLSKLVKRRPSVLGYSIEENMEPELKWLDNKTISLLIQRMPQLLHLSIEKI
jgi:hypothetical protein